MELLKKRLMELAEKSYRNNQYVFTNFLNMAEMNAFFEIRKEISYIHCEAYAAGELKHGTISLVTEGTPVIAIMNDPDTADKMISNIREVTSRGGDLLVIARENMPMPEEFKSRAVTLPETEPLLSAMLSASAVQLLAYHLSNELGIDVDKPRNLAKSVTVE